MVKRLGGAGTSIGMDNIKQRRLSGPSTAIPTCMLGNVFPSTCPRSIMLYAIHKANHPELRITAGKNSPGGGLAPDRNVGNAAAVCFYRLQCRLFSL